MMIKELFNPSSYFLNPYSIPNVIVVALCYSLVVFMLIKKRMAGISLVILNFTGGTWLLAFSVMYSSSSPFVAYLWDKIAYSFGICFISISSYFFSLVATKTINRKREKLILRSGYVVMAIFAVINIFTDLIVKYPPRQFFWGYYTNPGVLHHVFFPIWLGFAVESTLNLYRGCMREKDPTDKNRLKIFLNTYIFGYVAGIDYLAAYGVGIYPFGFIFISVYFVLNVYNFIRFKALGVETVIHKTVLWLTSITLLVLPAGIVTFLIARGLVGVLPPVILVAIFSTILIVFSYYYLYLRPKIDYLFGKKQYAYYELLGRISEKVSTTLDIEEFSQKLLNELDACILPQKIHLWLADEKTQEFFLFASKSLSQEPVINREDGGVFDGKDLIITHLRDTQKTLEVPLVYLNPRLGHLKESPYYSFLIKEKIEVVVPLTMERELVGLLGLGYKRSLRIYAKGDIEILNTLGRDLGTGIYNALHHQDILEKQRLQQEITLARNIQEMLLPQKPPEIVGISLYGLYVPSREIGGDYYDFIVEKRGEERAYITIGDVSGKGLDAGLVMSSMKSFLVSLVMYNDSCRQILDILNQKIYSHLNQQKFISMLLLQYISGEDKITYSAAGHEHILISRAGQQGENVEVIKSGGIILGMLDNIGGLLEEHTFVFNKGDKILLYTDGATEARNPKEELFGLPNLTDSFRRHANLPIEEAIHNIHQDIKEFVAVREQYDDITLVGIEKI